MEIKKKENSNRFPSSDRLHKRTNSNRETKSDYNGYVTPVGIINVGLYIYDEGKVKR